MTRAYPGIGDLKWIFRTEKEIQEKKKEMASLGLFQGARKKALRQEIEDLQRRMERTRDQILHGEVLGESFGPSDLVWQIANDPMSVPFGRMADTGEPILWQAADFFDTKVLLVSRYALMPRRFNGDFEETDWAACSLRRVLNEEFYPEAFSHEEKRRIEEESIRLDDLGETSFDRYKVFVLSREEVLYVFPGSRERQCQGLDLVKEGRRGADANVCWWLRTSTPDRLHALYITPGGQIDIDGAPVDTACDPGTGRKSDTDFSIYVRPAIWVQLWDGYIRDEEETKPGTYPGTEPGEEHRSVPGLLGEILTLNRQLKEKDSPDLKRRLADARKAVLSMGLSPMKPAFLIARDPEAVPFGRLSSGRERILWQVLKISGVEALLLCRSAFPLPESDAGPGEERWPKSRARDWLNGAFLTEYFSEEDRKWILSRGLPVDPSFREGDEDAPDHGIIIDYDPLDMDPETAEAYQSKVFLLSRKEAAHYLPSPGDRICRGTGFPEAGGKGTSGPVCWRLRCDGNGHVSWTDRAGAFREKASLTAGESSLLYLRPAMWINIGEDPWDDWETAEW